MKSDALCGLSSGVSWTGPQLSPAWYIHGKSIIFKLSLGQSLVHGRAWRITEIIHHDFLKTSLKPVWTLKLFCVAYDTDSLFLFPSLFVPRLSNKTSIFYFMK